ncbi:branched-chain amino acid dehydrogenase [Anaerosporomusa subterranea]|jgi:acetate CoA/acetoacetate CoA-transferase alpha subunit|uniref:Branched-chain amino acid dehydrogenase n=1 Tax=Anaerosporomusa subterranea TaxID=1794912 RepID=A0A154BRA7_ANASB|nr:3-oxoacid CoA-transferase subunit A [Anaerosporomusa subterranea]KYZ76461.1 branched-chain amino acid dehydrogenase [Anaerosporomusa subterranea]MDF2501577.1 branched-chain amino acid dehydrogenase [Anaerosporomusa subterranea]
MSKIKQYEEAVALFADGQTIMIGGFLGTGTPESLVDGLVARGVKNLNIIANDTAFPEQGVGKLITNKQAAKVIVSHIGTNPETGRQFNQQELDVEFSPQGTLAERIRCGGSGLGGVLTPTGVGTVVEQGKEKIVRGDKAYLLELPLKADIALIKAWRADTVGNLVYRRAARNFNPLMAMAAEMVIVEAEEIVEAGSLDPDEIMTPGIFVDMIIRG